MDLTQLRLNPEKHLELRNVVDDRVFMEKYEAVRDVIDRSHTEPEPWFLKMVAIDSVIGGNGVETLVADETGKAIAFYVNNGDKYRPTVLYDHEEQEFLVTSWGDFYEEWKNDHVIEVDCDSVAEDIYNISHYPFDWDNCTEGSPDEYDSIEDWQDSASIDVRLQVTEDNGYHVRWGDSQYDQDHRGAWGSSSVGKCRSMEDCLAIAKDLIEQAAESADCNLTKSIKVYNDDN